MFLFPFINFYEKILIANLFIRLANLFYHIRYFFCAIILVLKDCIYQLMKEFLAGKKVRTLISFATN